MISRALIRLFPFLCLLALAASAKHDDNRSRRMSRAGYDGRKELNRRLKGMDKSNKNKDASSAPPRMENDWRRLEGTDRANTRSNRRELRFLKEKSSTTKTKTKDSKTSKTDPASIEITQPVSSPTPPPTVAVTPAPTPVDRERERGIVSVVQALVFDDNDNDDDLIE